MSTQTNHPGHTPGEWVICQNNGPRFIAALTDRVGRIATIEDHPGDQRISCANARLIASSPDLLLMLQRLAEKTRRANAIQHSGGKLDGEDWSELHQLTNEAFGLIAKATKGA